MGKMLTVEQAAQAMGLSPRTVRSWIYQRRIGFSKVGGRAVRIPEDEIRRIVELGKHEAITI